MKKNNSIPFTTLILLLLLGIGLISCKKSTAGPAGEQGTAGLQGPAGPEGNANVKSSTFSIGCNWKADSTGKNYNYTYHTPSINLSVLQEGIVMLYMSDDLGNNGTEWKAIPYSTKDIDFSFKYALSEVEIFVTSSSGKMPSYPASQKFKLVIIPPAS